MADRKQWTAQELIASLISRKLFTRKELSDRLHKEGFRSEEIEAALLEFEVDGYVDDDSFIECYVEERRQFNPRGYHALYSELIQRGIPRSMLESFRTSQYPLAWEIEDARGLLDKWIRHDTAAIDTKERSRLTGRLVRRGFTGESIDSAWSDYPAEDSASHS